MATFDELMAPQTTVVNIRKEKYDVYIGRPSKWGNPFVIGRDGDRNTCLRKYKEWIKKQPQLLANLHELKGKTLGCYCSPWSLCHGDILVRLVEAL